MISPDRLMVGKIVAGEFNADRGFLDSQNPHITGADGKSYIVQPAVYAETGRRGNHLKTVASFDTFIVPTATDYSHDLVVAVPPGVTPREAYQAVEEGSLTTPAQIRQVIGKTAWNGAWTGFAPLNRTKEARRQDTEQKIVGMGRGYNGRSGQRPAVVWSVTDPSREGAGCTSRWDGSSLEVAKHGKWLSAGVGGVFVDLTGSYGTDGTDPYIEGAAGVCGYPFELPPLNKANILYRESEYKQTPGFRTPEAAFADFRAKIKDPNFTMLVLDGGQLDLSPPLGGGKGRETPQHGGPDLKLGDDVMLYHDPNYIGTVVATADRNDPDHLALSFYDDHSLSKLLVYATEEGGNGARLLKVKAGDALNYQADENGKSEGGWFTDSQDGRLKGRNIGEVHVGQPPTNTPLYHLEVFDNLMGLEPVLK